MKKYHQKPVRMWQLNSQGFHLYFCSIGSSPRSQSGGREGRAAPLLTEASLLMYEGGRAEWEKGLSPATKIVL